MRRLIHRGGSAEHAPRSRARLITYACTAAAALVLIVGAVWLVVTAVLARHELNAVRQELPTLRHALSDGDFNRASSVAHRLEGHARRAHTLTSGPAWAVTAAVPWAGRPVQTSRILSRQSDRLGSKVLPGVLELAHDLSEDTPRHGAQIDLTRLARAAPVLDHAAGAASTAAHAVAKAPAHTWLGSVNSARSSVLGQLGPVADQLDGAARAVHTLLPMLGQSGTRRYFVGFLNEAESRGLGGLPGAFAIVIADHGTVKFTHFENDNALHHVHVHLDLGPDFNARYGKTMPTKNYGNSDWSPHFPDAARIWAAMWEKKSGEHIDGALAIDPTALSYLLKVTGPATMADGERITAGNVVELTEKDQYSRFDNDAARKLYLVELAQAVSHRLIDGGSGDTKALVRAAGHAAGERRLVIWSSDPAVEANLVRADYAGVVESGGAPFTGFVVSSPRSGKLDYYLGRSMTYHRSGCGPASPAVATFTLTNHAPASGLPIYVTTRLDQPPPGAKPGDNRLLVTYYASAGARITSMTVGGKPIAIKAAPENGLITVTADIEVPVGASRTLTIRLTEPAATKPLDVLKQPLVRPVRVQVSGASC